MTLKQLGGFWAAVTSMSLLCHGATMAADTANLWLYSSFDNATPSIPGVLTQDVAGTNHAITDGGALVVDGSPPSERSTAINYTGTDADLTSFGNVLDVGMNNQSVSLWFNAGDLTGTQFIASKGNNGSGDNGWSMWLSNDGLIMRGEYSGSDNGTQNLGVNIGGLTANTWYHAGLVIDNTNGSWQGYLNGLGSGVSGTENGWAVGVATAATHGPAILRAGEWLDRGWRRWRHKHVRCG